MTYSDSDFVVDFYKQGEEIQAELYRVRGAEPSYDLIDEILIPLRGDFGPTAATKVILAWQQKAEADFAALGWGEPTEQPIAPLGIPYRSNFDKEVYSISVKVSYDFLESVR